jgi:hypothetical protein
VTAAERLGYRTDRRPVQMRNSWTPDGDKGVAITICLMQYAAQAGAQDPKIRELALKIVSGVPNNDRQGEIDAIYNWVKDNIAFRGEHDETVQAPEVTLRFEGADCDCQSVLVAALLGSIGYPVNFKTVASVGEKDFSHVYAEVLDDSTGQWRALPLDTTVAEASPGWEPPHIGRAKEWPAVGLGRFMRRHGRLRGLGQDDGSGDSTGSQIADVIAAAGPIITAFRPQPQPMYMPGYGVVYPNTPTQYSTPYYSPAGNANVPFSPNTNRTPTASFTAASIPWWGWALLGFGGLALFKSGESRGRR